MIIQSFEDECESSIKNLQILQEIISNPKCLFEIGVNELYISALKYRYQRRKRLTVHTKN